MVRETGLEHVCQFRYPRKIVFYYPKPLPVSTETYPEYEKNPDFSRLKKCDFYLGKLRIDVPRNL